MKLVRGLLNLERLDASVVAIGNFDGMHKGHQAIIAELAALAKEKALPSVVLTFYPLARQFFNAGAKLPTLATRRELFLKLSQLNVDYLVWAAFNTKFAKMSAMTFIDEVLKHQLNAKACIVGEGFRFGANRSGDVAMLRATAGQGYTLKNVSQINVHNTRVSSSNIRDALRAGDLLSVKEMLGHNYTISGRVVNGAGRGKTLGYPTINVGLKGRAIALSGVFIVTVVVGGRQLNGVANLGNRPTFYSNDKTTLEVFLFDFDQGVYNEFVEVSFLKKIRPEQKFSSKEALVTQIHKDVKFAKGFFARIRS